jgi:hypothetical protein
MSNEWYEVHTDDERTRGLLAHECGEVGCENADVPAPYDRLSDARDRAEEVREEVGPKPRIWIVRVTEERVEDVPATVTPAGLRR